MSWVSSFYKIIFALKIWILSTNIYGNILKIFFFILSSFKLMIWELCTDICENISMMLFFLLEYFWADDLNIFWELLWKFSYGVILFTIIFLSWWFEHFFESFYENFPMVLFSLLELFWADDLNISEINYENISRVLFC